MSGLKAVPVVLFFVTFFFSGCVTPMTYHEGNIFGSGYGDMKTGEDEWRVGMHGGNMYMSEIGPYITYRAAEVAYENGYGYFEMLDPGVWGAVRMTDPTKDKYCRPCNATSRVKMYNKKPKNTVNVVFNAVDYLNNNPVPGTEIIHGTKERKAETAEE
ncbi:MAG: hypothetical protein CVV21_11445 [Candidatus Goldiibacteriota bacterium HGW-Goldbacteria-1]|jgi:hypothetical protein|nr:MAG: hypothetical protein CVV21_11445 [Candidatus Goldiibacteriota bacterium HGW-Goldbacteria-1]